MGMWMLKFRLEVSTGTYFVSLAGAWFRWASLADAATWS